MLRQGCSCSFCWRCLPSPSAGARSAELASLFQGLGLPVLGLGLSSAYHCHHLIPTHLSLAPYLHPHPPTLQTATQIQAPRHLQCRCLLWLVFLVDSWQGRLIWFPFASAYSSESCASTLGSYNCFWQRRRTIPALWRHLELSGLPRRRSLMPRSIHRSKQSRLYASLQLFVCLWPSGSMAAASAGSAGWGGLVLSILLMRMVVLLKQTSLYLGQLWVSPVSSYLWPTLELAAFDQRLPMALDLSSPSLSWASTIRQL